jgi:hypothetical protein
MPGHNTSLFVLGVMILWFGWYGFNPGSQLILVGGTNSDAVANAALTTTIAPGVAGMSALFAKSFIGRKAAGPPLCPSSTADPFPYFADKLVRWLAVYCSPCSPLKHSPFHSLSA